MWYGRSVDDLHAADSEGDGEASAITRLVVEAWLGWKLDAAKSVDQAPSTIVLGVEAAARGDQLVFQVPAEKSDKWLCEIDAILAEGKCSPTRARGQAFLGGQRSFRERCASRDGARSVRGRHDSRWPSLLGPHLPSRQPERLAYQWAVPSRPAVVAVFHTAGKPRAIESRATGLVARAGTKEGGATRAGHPPARHCL